MLAKLMASLRKGKIGGRVQLVPCKLILAVFFSLFEDLRLEYTTQKTVPLPTSHVAIVIRRKSSQNYIQNIEGNPVADLIIFCHKSICLIFYVQPYMYTVHCTVCYVCI